MPWAASSASVLVRRRVMIDPKSSAPRGPDELALQTRVATSKYFDLEDSVFQWANEITRGLVHDGGTPIRTRPRYGASREQPTHGQSEELIRPAQSEGSIEFGPGVLLDALRLATLYNSERGLAPPRMETNSRRNPEN